tara:strand:+ start:701 stop:1081 length:381 start_codon:yes stop_codon:yes gene_type:complete
LRGNHRKSLSKYLIFSSLNVFKKIVKIRGDECPPSKNPYSVAVVASVVVVVVAASVVVAVVPSVVSVVVVSVVSVVVVVAVVASSAVVSVVVVVVPHATKNRTANILKTFFILFLLLNNVINTLQI